ncbi:MAG: allantoinase AllB [Acidobacteria bacterium]|nr:allantoinase AllB [Acidobacteriota bacterium]MCA1642030.1 allantoinase AllB [Acidobacteriota bacterium]
MTKPDLVIRGRRVVLPGGTRAASVHVREGRVVAVVDYDEAPRGCRVFEAVDDSVVMPGLVDTHVHVNEPGRTEWEGFETATRAAAAGGTTTVVEMPLNSIPATTSLDAFRAKLAAAEGKCAVDVAFWGGVVPGNAAELKPMTEAGVVGFKCFLVDSGVAEFRCVSEEDLRAALPELARLDAVLIAHAELSAPIEEAARSPAARNDPRAYATFLATRPRAAEDAAVELLIRLSRETGARVHVVHHSSADALPALREARAGGVRITAETCPHYLAFASEEIADGATEFKCCPPIRERENRERLWAALGENLIEMIVSDHSPCPPGMKRREEGDFLAAWGGISSLQLRLPVVWTEARRRGFPVERLSEWLAAAPARLAGLQDYKGAIRVGADADFVVWNPDEKFRVEPSALQHRHKLTPYTGRELSGVVEATFLRGEKIYERGEFAGEPKGKFLLRGGGRV